MSLLSEIFPKRPSLLSLRELGSACCIPQIQTGASVGKAGTPGMSRVRSPLKTPHLRVKLRWQGADPLWGLRLSSADGHGFSEVPSGRV